jgi:hypothetical protein
MKISALNLDSLSYSFINLLELINYKLFISALMMEAAPSCDVSVSIHMPNRWQDSQVYAVFFHSVMQTHTNFIF